MTIAINYKNTATKLKPSNQVLFVEQNFSISGLKKYFSNSEYSYTAELLKSSDLKKKNISF